MQTFTDMSLCVCKVYICIQVYIHTYVYMKLVWNLKSLQIDTSQGLENNEKFLCIGYFK